MRQYRYFPPKSPNPAPDEKEIRTISKTYQSPVVWLEISENDYAVVIDQAIVLRYKNYEKSFLSYCAAFSVFNMSWLTVIQVCTTK